MANCCICRADESWFSGFLRKISDKTELYAWIFQKSLEKVQNRRILYSMIKQGRIAQLVRAPRWHRGGHRFEFYYAHHPSLKLRMAGHPAIRRFFLPAKISEVQRSVRRMPSIARRATEGWNRPACPNYRIQAARTAIRRFFLPAKISGVQRSVRRMPSIARRATEGKSVLLSVDFSPHRRFVAKDYWLLRYGSSLSGRP